MTAKMTRRREDAISFAVRFAEAKLDSFQGTDWRRLRRDFSAFFEARGRAVKLADGRVAGFTIDQERTGGVVAIPGDGVRGTEQMTNADFENLQRRLRSILQRVAWSRDQQENPVEYMLTRSKGVRPQPTFRARDVEVRFSGTVEIIATGDGKAAILLSGQPEETFLTTLLFVLSRAKRLPIGICLECHRLFHREGKRRYCDKRCTWRASQRAKRAGLSKPRKRRHRRK